MSRTLYELTGIYKELYEAETGEDGLSEEAWIDTMQGIEAELNEKAENVAIIFKQFQSDADAMKNEEKHLAERRKTIENKADRLKAYLMNMLTAAGKDKIEGSKAKISITKGRESVVITDAELLIAYPDVWKPYDFTEKNISKTVVGELLNAGLEVKGAELVRKPGITIK